MIRKKYDKIPDPAPSSTAFLIQTEKLPSVVLQHMEKQNQGDVLFFRQLQGDLSKYYKKVYEISQFLSKNQNFSIALTVNKSEGPPNQARSAPTYEHEHWVEELNNKPMSIDPYQLKDARKTKPSGLGGKKSSAKESNEDRLFELTVKSNHEEVVLSSLSNVSSQVSKTVADLSLADILVKHLENALQEIKEASLGVILEEVHRVPNMSSKEDLEKFKQKIALDESSDLEKTIQ